MPEYIDTFEITGATGRGNFDFSGYEEEAVHSEFIKQSLDGTNALKRAHASLLYHSTPDRDQMQQFHKDFKRSRKIKVDGIVRYDSADPEKNNETVKQKMATEFQVHDPRKTAVLRSLHQGLSADLMVFMRENYALQDSQGKKLTGIFPVPHDLFDIEHEKRGEEYSYRLRSPVYFLNGDDGNTYSRNHKGEVILVEDIEDMRDPDPSKKYKPITHFEITATLDATKEPYSSSFRVLIESDPPIFAYQGPKKDTHIAISVEQVKKVPLSEVPTALNKLTHDLRKTFIQDSNRALKSGEQTEYLSNLEAVLKSPAFRNCLDLKNLAQDAPALRDTAEALNRLLENHIQAKPSRFRKITNALRITKRDPLVTFQMALSTLIKGIPLSLPEKVAPNQTSSVEATVSKEGNKPEPRRAALAATDLNPIKNIAQNLEAIGKAQRRELPQSKQAMPDKDKLKKVLPSLAITDEFHAKHQGLMEELKKIKPDDGLTPTAKLHKTSKPDATPPPQSRKKPRVPPKSGAGT